MSQIKETLLEKTMDRDYSIDTARALSMLYIIAFWHMTAYTNYYKIGWIGDYIKNAALGTFMFISSYNLGRKYKFQSFTHLKNFYAKRAARIFPLFIVSLSSYWITGLFELPTIIFSLVGISIFLPPMMDTLWFVSMIISFYLVFPIFSSKTPHFQLSVLSILIIVTFNLKELGIIAIDRRFFYYFPCFIIGSILAPFPIRRICNQKFCSLCLIIFLTAAFCQNSDMISMHRYAVRCIVSLAGIFVILSISNSFSKIHRLRLLISWVAYGSLGSYLFHRQLFDIIEKYLFWPNDGLGRYLYLMLFCLPLILLIGSSLQVTYNWFLKNLIPCTSTQGVSDR